VLPAHRCSHHSSRARLRPTCEHNRQGIPPRQARWRISLLSKIGSNTQAHPAALICDIRRTRHDSQPGQARIFQRVATPAEIEKMVQLPGSDERSAMAFNRSEYESAATATPLNSSRCAPALRTRWDLQQHIRDEAEKPLTRSRGNLKSRTGARSRALRTLVGTVGLWGKASDIIA